MRTFLASMTCVLLGGLAVSAHHSFAAVYHEDQRVTFEGEVVQFEYRAPHAWLHVRVVPERGEPLVYAAEWSNPNRLKRDGILAETLRPGDAVHVAGSPARDRSMRQVHLKFVERPSDGWSWGVRRPPSPATRGGR